MRRYLAIETILVAIAIDDSTATEKAFQTLQQLQLAPTAKIILSHVMEPMDLGQEQAANKPPFRHLEKQLQAYQQHLPWPSKIEIVTGDPADEIIRLANIYQVDLIIIRSRGLTGVKRILEGSVSAQVVADAACSV